MYSLLKVLQKLAEYGKVNAEKKNLDFRFEMSDNMPWKLAGEPEDLLHLGTVLLADAIKYTGSGYIALSADWKKTEENKGQLCIGIRDTGVPEKERVVGQKAVPESSVQIVPVSGEGMKVLFCSEQQTEAVGEDDDRNRETKQKELLTVFLEEEKVEDLEAFYEIKDWVNYRIVLHELKHVSKAIGRMHLSELAGQMELAAKEKNIYFAEMHHNELIKICREELSQVAELLFGKKADAVPVPEAEKNGQILVVDDDIKNGKTIKKILAERFEVDCVTSGKDALKFLEEKRTDIILLDMHMPDMDGFEVMKLLQKKEETRGIPVIFLTADRNRSLESKGFKAGAQDIIIKPFAAEVLTQRVRHVFELSRLQNNLQKEVEKQTAQAEERRKKIETLSKQIVEALVETIDAKDAYTQGHSGRVAEYSVLIAERAGKTKEEVERIRYMGLLHDIGKIGIPDAIISKNSSLSDKEYFVTRKHPEIGAEILEKITEIPDLSVGARYHHERYDGTGYPEGRAENYIPEEARIIAVADAYDAMASKRSYRDVLPQKVVYEEIQMGRGTQFDPVFADIMLELMEEDVNYDMREK